MLDKIDRFSLDEPVLRECPVCGDNNSVFLYSKFNFNLHRCVVCDSKFVNNVLSAEKTKELYSDEFEKENWDSIASKRMLDGGNVQFGNKALEISKFNSGVGNVLEVGFGDGILLHAFEEHGWRLCSGVEISEHNVSIAKKLFPNLDVQTSEEFEDSDKSYDLIYMEQVLEHLPCPKVIVERYVSRLNVGGILYVSAPHGQSLAGMLLGIYDGQVLPPWHINFFSRRGCKFFAESLGLDVISFESYKADVPLVNLVSKWLGVPAIPRASINFDFAFLRESLLLIDKMFFSHIMNGVAKKYNRGSYFKAWFRKT